MPMDRELRRNKDFWAGSLFLASGAVAVVAGRHYPFGSTLHMGPGYFPRVLGGILIVFGLYLALKGLRRAEHIEGGWSLRGLIVLPLSLVLFGVLMDHAGFLPALAALVFGSAAAGREFRLREVLLLAVILTGLSVGLFVWGLGLPYPLVKLF
jgi:hypothetical protein